VKTESKPPVAKAAIAPSNANGFRMIPLGELASNPDQPRQQWDSAKDEEGKGSLDRLAESIKAEGILQPLVVTPKNGGKFLIVCGERRFRAAKLVGLKEVPCVVREGLSDREVLELSITENLQRAGLTPIDQARAMKALMDKCGYKQADLAKRLGLSVAAVNYKLSLLQLPQDLQTEVKRGALTETQGRTIVQAVRKIKEPEKKEKALKAVKEHVAKATNGRKGGPKLTTKDVATIAKVAASAVMKPSEAPKEPKAPTAKEQTMIRKFQETIGSALRALEWIGDLAASSAQRARLAELAIEANKGIGERVKQMHILVSRIHEDLQEAARKRALAASTHPVTK